ncbi:ATP-binding protein [Desulforhopalus sp. IMCC35007]|uniref:hybrid sensor histidine kinase/response regulator n=1 Tax=Desulforhopalus sp. IMCC35007 TaxID=2569543 RepID=UPI0010ADE171|nr:ATP-binding protein [Desulforhopalus sp. IMCC35007]TKB06923.1 response regulator [Desulforhopalus sp. IMCC35007]
MNSKQKATFRVRYSVGRKFAVIIALISLLAGIALALVLAKINIRHAHNEFQQMVERLHLSSEKALVKSLWLKNDDMVQSIIEGLDNLPGVEEIRLIQEDGQVMQTGKAISKKYYSHTHDLIFNSLGKDIYLGNLSITIGLDAVNRSIFIDTLKLCLVVGVLALLVGVGTISIFYLLVGRHLQDIASHCAGLDWSNLAIPLALKRRLSESGEDELGQITTSLNQTCISLKKKMSEVQEKESLFKTIVVNSSDAILRFDRDGKITYINPAAQKQRAEKWQESLDEKLEPVVFKQVCEEKDSIEVKLQFDGAVGKNQMRSFQLKLTPEIGSDGSVESIIGIARDITIQDQKDKLLQAVFTHAPMLMIIEEIDSGEVYDVNDRFTATTGYLRQDILGKKLVALGFTSESNRGLIKEHLDKQGFFDDLEMDFVHRDGRTLTLRCSGQVINVLGNKKRLSICQDITMEKKMLVERRSMEQQLLQASKLEAIGTLAGGIAHDFNNILMAIIGYGQMALEDTPRSSSVHGDLKQILLAGRRAAELTKQILLFSRQGIGEMAPYKLQGIVKEVVKLLRSTIPATIELVTDIDEKSRAALLDPTQIHQVLMNILTNARQAIGAGHGKITIGLREIDWNASLLSTDGQPLKKGSYLELIIEDSGAGMSPEVVSRIFEPFFTTKAKGEGTGMGMAVCHGIIAKHKGSIAVESALGVGTKFSIYLPVSEEQETARADLVDRSAMKGSERLLLVDDEKELLEMQQRSLENLGYQTTSFFSSVQALAYFKKHSDSIDMVITDMTIPQMTGAEMSEQMLALRPDLPIIICTGYSEVLDADTASRMGIAFFVLKPVIIHQLAIQMRKIFDGSATTATDITANPAP